MLNWIEPAGSRRWRFGRAGVALAVVIAGACAKTDDAPDTTPAKPVVSSKYVPEGDEGLGVSIAIVVDNSGSMAKAAGGDSRPKFVVARRALEQMLASTDSFVAKQPDTPINVGLFQFSSGVVPLVPVKKYDRQALRDALNSMPYPKGGTAIGTAMESARASLYRAGTIRKYILVVTDGENTDGPPPSEVAREINRRSEGAVRMYFVAFDVDAKKFGFLREVHGDVLGASNGVALRASLDTIYRGRILAEAMDAGESLPARRADTTAGKDPSKPSTIKKP